MGLAKSPVDIFNLALGHLNEDTVSGIEGKTLTPIEAIGARHYDLDRTSLLQATRWNFATKAFSIPKVSDSPVKKYSDTYAFPVDYLRLQAIKDPNIPLTRMNYDVNGRNLLYNGGGADSLDIWYTFNEENIRNFPPVFIKLLSLRLAISVGYEISAKPSVRKDLGLSLIMATREAVSFNGQERPPTVFSANNIIESGYNDRYGFTYKERYPTF